MTIITLILIAAVALLAFAGVYHAAESILAPKRQAAREARALEADRQELAGELSMLRRSRTVLTARILRMNAQMEGLHGAAYLDYAEMRDERCRELERLNRKITRRMDDMLFHHYPNAI